MMLLELAGRSYFKNGERYARVYISLEKTWLGKWNFEIFKTENETLIDFIKNYFKDKFLGVMSDI